MDFPDVIIRKFHLLFGKLIQSKPTVIQNKLLEEVASQKNHRSYEKLFAQFEREFHSLITKITASQKNPHLKDKYTTLGDTLMLTETTYDTGARQQTVQPNSAKQRADQPASTAASTTQHRHKVNSKQASSKDSLKKGAPRSQHDKPNTCSEERSSSQQRTGEGRKSKASSLFSRIFNTGKK